eukprot:102773_1
MKRIIKKIKKVKLNKKKMVYKKLKLDKLINKHKGTMKKDKVLLKQMKHLNKLMKNVRKQKITNIPNRKPIWLPLYFWHWLHHFPHFHQLNSLINKIKYLNKHNKFNALLGIDNVYSNDDDQIYNQLVE